MPYRFASLKIAITLAFVGSVISETVASNEGIGYLMLSASSSYNVPLVFAGLIVVAVMGVLMYAVAVWFERRMTGWARSEEHTSELQSLMSISYAVFGLKKKTKAHRRLVKNQTVSIL